MLIVNGVSFLGRNLARIVLDQGAFVSILSEFDDYAREFIKQFKDSSFKFFDISMVSGLQNKIERLDYVVVLLDNLPKANLKTEELLNWQNLLNHVYELAYEKDAKVVVVTSMAWKKTLEATRESDAVGYIPEEVQMFGEKALMEFVGRVNLDGRVVRLGSVYGHGMNVDESSGLVKTINQALTQEEIVVPGDGLRFTYYIHVLDAVYGTIKAVFSNKTKGQIYTLANPEEMSLLTLAHKVLENTVVAKGVRFEKEEKETEPLYEKGYIPSKSLEEIGWKPKITFERGLAQTIDYFKELRGMKEEDSKKGGKNVSDEESGIKLSIKMDDVMPVEMSKERARFEKIKKEKAARKRREFKVKASTIVKYLIISLSVLLGLALYFFFIVPVIGIGRTVFSTRNSLNSYMGHIRAGEMDQLSADVSAVDDSVEELEVYLARMSWLFELTETTSGADRIVANVYAARSTMKGFGYLLEVENGKSVIFESAKPAPLDLHDRQALIQAKIELKDASMWFDKGARIPQSESFWLPYDQAESQVDLVLNLL